MRSRALQAREQAVGRPLYYTEWNITSNPRDPLRDQSFAAALAVRIAMSVDDVVDAYSFWTFSDIFEENYFPSVPFHGGFGLMNIHGIAKPIYRAFQFMLQFGDVRYPTEGNHETVAVWVGRKIDGAHAPTNILLINQAMPRHAINDEPIQVCLSGTDGRHSRKVLIARIDEDHCNPARAWRDLGQPEYLSTAELEKIRSASEPAPTILACSEEGGVIVIDVTLPPQSLALVSIEWEHHDPSES
ncbi:hypothetical protein ACFQAT_00445 [Undibacterium arcticum]